MLSKILVIKRPTHVLGYMTLMQYHHELYTLGCIIHFHKTHNGKSIIWKTVVTVIFNKICIVINHSSTLFLWSLSSWYINVYTFSDFFKKKYLFIKSVKYISQRWGVEENVIVTWRLSRRVSLTSLTCKCNCCMK